VDTMKALVKAEPGPGLRLKDVPVPPLRANDVLIRVHKTAICGTDLHIYNWDEWARRTIPVPMQIGHELVGRVEATGEDAAEFEKGFEAVKTGRSGKVVLNWTGREAPSREEHAPWHWNDWTKR